MSTTTLSIHPLALLIPEMDADQFAELRADVEHNGLIDPIVLLDGQILDGRHRYRACVETNVEPRFEDFNGPSPVEFVLSKNVKRRHLTPSQRAAIVVEFLPQLEREARRRQEATQLAGRDKDGNYIGPAPGTRTESSHRAREDAGALVGVSGASVDRARRVKELDPEAFEQVKAGTLPVRTADNAIRERRAQENGGGTTPKPPTRDGSRRRSSEELVTRVLSKLVPTVAALEHFDWASAITSEAPLAEWDRQLTDDIIVPLSRLRGDIRKVLFNG